ncbi:MAG: HAD family hydrolase [Candidatus Aenigmatarchaeota archaeon]
MDKAIFIDRDGTINYNRNGYIYKIEDFEIIPGVIEGLKLLDKIKAYKIIITNQSGIARGIYTEDDLHKLMNYMFSILEKNGIKSKFNYYFCPHHPTKAKIEKYKIDCNCRKPKTGMFEQAIKDYNLDPKKCFCIDDSWKGIEPMLNLGGKGILIKKNGKRFEKNYKEKIIESRNNVIVADNLYQAALILYENKF